MIIPDRTAGPAARSLRLVTAQTLRIGYDATVRIGKFALAESTTLKQAAEQLGYARSEDFDRRGIPAAMTLPGARLPGGGG